MVVVTQAMRRVRICGCPDATVSRRVAQASLCVTSRAKLPKRCRTPHTNATCSRAWTMGRSCPWQRCYKTIDYRYGAAGQVISDPKLADPAGLELGDQQAAFYPFVCPTSCSYTQKDLIAVFLDNMTDSEWPKVGVLERRSLARWRTRVSIARPRQSLELGIAEVG
jgi:hypothetical protein